MLNSRDMKTVQAVSNNPNDFATKVGEWWNRLTGVYSANEFNAAEAQKQRDWEKMMSDTAVQRAAKDYASAGFNSANALNHAASTPSGSSAKSVGVGSNIMDGLSALANAAKTVGYLYSLKPEVLSTTRELVKSKTGRTAAGIAFRDLTNSVYTEVVRKHR